MTFRPHRRGTYVPLSSTYMNDARVLEAGYHAELVFVRALARCAAEPTDGFLTEAQLRALMPGYRRVMSAVGRLVAVGLFKRDDKRGGYVVVNWLKWNPSQEEIRAGRARDAERKRSTGVKRLRPESDRNPSGIRAEREGVPPGFRPSDTESDTDTESSDRTPSGPVRSDATGERPRASAARPPVPDWRRERRAAKPPDLSDVRKLLTEASKATRARENRRTDALAELDRAVKGPDGDAEGREP